MPVSSEEEALKYLNIIKQRHWDARHNVYAYVIKENNLMRYSDDGEPGGTAGVPILEILKKEELESYIFSFIIFDIHLKRHHDHLSISRNVDLCHFYWLCVFLLYSSTGI